VEIRAILAGGAPGPVGVVPAELWNAERLNRLLGEIDTAIAAAILRQSLQIARQKLGLKRVLVTCDDDNVGSIKTIEKNGGAFESIVIPDGDKPKRRYWIATVD
jgi:predicted acetyltransferase